MIGIKPFFVALVLATIPGILSMPLAERECTTNDIDCRRAVVREEFVRCTTNDIDCRAAEVVRKCTTNDIDC